jgi:hypothetical protein
VKTAHSIEEQEERKAARDNEKHDGKGENSISAGNGLCSEKRARSLRNLKPWKPGQSGNPKGGSARHDLAAEVARAIFENNPDMVYKAFAKAIAKGNAYAFQVLADRGYGKLKESIAHEISPYSGLSEDELRQKIAKLEDELGIVHSEPPALPPADDSKPN